MKKIVHIITGLNNGGAENMLYKVLKNSDIGGYEHHVISLLSGGLYGEKIRKLGIQVCELGLTRRNFISALSVTRKMCEDADLIDTWLYHADLFGFIVSKVLLKKKLIWNIRHSNLDKSVNKASTLKIIKLNSILSNFVDCITYNSSEAFKNHMRARYKDRRSLVIPNGFELDRFKFNLESRIVVRRDLGIKDEKLIITVGRWNMQKDYDTLFKALQELKKYSSNFKILMVGTNLDSSNKELISCIERCEMQGHTILLGVREDIPDLLSAADIYISSSLGESFSNAIGEAMACELHCIVTDVGDSKLMIGDTGKIVEAKDYLSMSQGLLSLVNNVNTLRNSRARIRIIDNYEVKKVVKIFNDNYFKFLV